MRVLARRFGLAASIIVGVLGLGASSSLASSPWWQLTSGARPSYLPAQAGGTGEIDVTAENLGDASLDGKPGTGSPIVIADTLPAGLEATAIHGSSPGPASSPNDFFRLSCSLVSLSCRYEGMLTPYATLEVRIAVKVRAGAQSGELNRVSATGGGAASASQSRPVVLSESPTPFGVEEFQTRFEEEGGGLDTRAGSHPFQMTTIVTVNQGADVEPSPNPENKPRVTPVGLAKDIFTKFPVGFIGDPTPVPTCSLSNYFRQEVGSVAGGNPEQDYCPAQSAVGVASVTIFEPSFLQYATFTVPLFVLEPYFGEPARFGFIIPIGNVPVVLDAALRSGAGEGAVPGESEDLGIDVNSTNISQTAGLISARVTVWGTPGDPRHDNSRGWSCMYETEGALVHGPCEHSEGEHPPAFLTLPTSCGDPLQASVEADSWEEPSHRIDYLPSEPMPALEGCNRLPFAPKMDAAPTTDSASSASGLDVNLDFHDEGLLSEEGLGQSHLKDTVVTLPEGFTINPSSGVGLVGCTSADYARETLTSAPGAGCPDESKLGTVEVTTPVLTSPIHGSLYIAQPYENPFPEPAAGHPNGTLVALYIVARNPETGIFFKLAGKVTPNPVTGQLVTTFENNPQLPFSHFNFHFREGQQAPLITPATCGTYTTQAVLTPWSDPLDRKSVV